MHCTVNVFLNDSITRTKYGYGSSMQTSSYNILQLTCTWSFLPVSIHILTLTQSQRKRTRNYDYETMHMYFNFISISMTGSQSQRRIFAFAFTMPLYLSSSSTITIIGAETLRLREFHREPRPALVAVFFHLAIFLIPAKRMIALCTCTSTTQQFQLE